MIDQTPKKLIDLNERLVKVESRHEDACAMDDTYLAAMLEHLIEYIEQEIADLTAAQA